MQVLKENKCVCVSVCVFGIRIARAPCRGGDFGSRGVGDSRVSGYCRVFICPSVHDRAWLHDKSLAN